MRTPIRHAAIAALIGLAGIAGRPSPAMAQSLDEGFIEYNWNSRHEEPLQRTNFSKRTWLSYSPDHPKQQQAAILDSLYQKYYGMPDYTRQVRLFQDVLYLRLENHDLANKRCTPENPPVRYRTRVKTRTDTVYVPRASAHAKDALVLHAGKRAYVLDGAVSVCYADDECVRLEDIKR